MIPGIDIISRLSILPFQVLSKSVIRDFHVHNDEMEACELHKPSRIGPFFDCPISATADAKCAIVI